MDHSLIFIKVNLLLILMFFASYILRKISIPPIVTFLIIGFTAQFWIEREGTEILEIFKEAGIILLFFFIGLEYSLERLRNVIRIWKPALVDLLLNFFPIFFLAKAFGFSTVTSLLIAGAFYPSSTSIVAKLLMDFRRLALPEAELLIGILIFEDLFSILLISGMVPLKQIGSVDPSALLISIAKLFLVLVIFLLLHRFVVPEVRGFLERASEDENFIFFLVGFILLIGFTFRIGGLSEVLGAFLAGVLVPEGRVMHNVERHLSAFKELSIGIFFFFFAFESELSLPGSILPLVVLAVAGIILKVVSTYIAARIYGMKKKSVVRTSLSFIPRGEFSVIISSFDPVVRAITIPFIFFSAILGSFSFAFAPRVADALVGKKKVHHKES